MQKLAASLFENLHSILSGRGQSGCGFPRGRRLTLTASQRKRIRSRAGLASFDYVLILGVVLSLVTWVMWIGPRIMRLAYQMACVLISWPFM